MGRYDNPGERVFKATAEERFLWANLAGTVIDLFSGLDGK